MSYFKIIPVLLLSVLYFTQAKAQDFTIDNDSGCDSITVNFTNLHPSGDYAPVIMQTTGFTYQWDFGNGGTSTEENPEAVTYTEPGTYVVSYSVTIDTVGFYLNQVDILAVNCNDPFGGGIDPYMIITDNSGSEVYNNIDNYIDEADIPFYFNNVNLHLNNPPYYVRIWDYDSTDGNDNCIDDSEESPGSGIPVFLPANDETGFGETDISGSSSNDLLEYNFHLEKTVYTYTSTDTIHVYESPAAPVLSYYSVNVCPGVSVLDVTATGENITWYSDSLLVNEIATGNTLTIAETALGTYKYYAVSENLNSCKSNYAVVIVQIGDIPSPVIVNNNAVFCMGENIDGIRALGTNLTWYSDSLLQNQVHTGDTLPITENSPGTYTYYVTQTDTTGSCVSSAAEANFEILPGIEASLNVEPALCADSQDGQISVNISSGTAPYTYLWSDESTDSVLTGISSGEYSLVLMDNNHCLKVLSEYVFSPEAITIDAIENDISCFGEQDGSISLTISGGTGDYDILWSNTETGQTISGLEQGSYDVTVSDENNCTANYTGQISEPTLLEFTYNTIKEECSGSYNGEIHLNVTGGTPPYSFNWSNGVQDSVAYNLHQGVYNITVRDNNWCSEYETITLESVYDRCIVPATVITPNNDGKNDTWRILYIENYDNPEIYVYDRNGVIVFESTGYSTEWDGTYSGKELPVGSYFYVIRLNNDSEDLHGVVDIVR